MKNYGICELSVVPVRKNQGSKNEMVTQLLFGEIFTIIKLDEKWSKISNEYDNYIGWVNNIQIKFIDKISYESIKKNKPFYSTNNKGYLINKYKSKISVPLGSLISSSKFLETTFQGELSNLNRDNIPKVSMLFLDSPYLWGGRTTHGIDCSGFSQIIYKVCGIKISRDARQQAVEGKLIDKRNVNCGDLAFFGESKKEITHVGIMINKSEIIHAFGKIRIDKVNMEGIINSKTGKNTHKLIEFRNY